MSTAPVIEPVYFNRDISWLAFNRRVLAEAASDQLPIAECIKFLAIFSSNLDEFYSVRVPVITALKEINGENMGEQVQELVAADMREFGRILKERILPGLRQMGVHLVYDEPIPESIQEDLATYFYERIAGFIQPLILDRDAELPHIENNKLYLLVALEKQDQKETLALVNVPVEHLSRFNFIDNNETGLRTIVFLEDIIKQNLHRIFPGYAIKGAFCLKMTRNADLDLFGEFKGSLARKLEKKLKMRDFGPPTRLLYEPGISPAQLKEVVHQFGLANASLLQGGHYHNLKELLSLPLPKKSGFYETVWPAKQHPLLAPDHSLFDLLDLHEIMVHTPYQSFHPVLRFFNEAALDEAVSDVYVSIYRVAKHSQIIHALISAARNGKKVTVFVELKARFDEANNLHWSKKMKDAGIRIVYSAPELKVHAKIALVKRKHLGKYRYYSLLASGNLNENTATLYTDHFMFTSDHAPGKELETLFKYLVGRSKLASEKAPSFSYLLVSPFNLYAAFADCIDRESEAARQGLPAGITVKLNNLEEKSLIRKLYEASQAGVKIQLLVRGICCLVPGVPGLSENISVTRIVDRYLEHGRIFIFHNQGSPKVFTGSSDWMNRNIHHRIEVCFPVLDESIKNDLIHIVALQLADNVQAISLGSAMQSIRKQIISGQPTIRSQEEVYKLF